MRIRLKLFLLLICISLVPLVLLRMNGIRVLLDLGEDLASQARSSLVSVASEGLIRLVEDHARVLGLQRRLAETTLNFAAAEMEKRLAEEKAATILSFPAHIAQVVNATALADRYCTFRGAVCERFSVDFDAVRVSGGTEEDRREADMLRSLTPVFQSIASTRGNEILWQEVRFRDGVTGTYPAYSGMPEVGMGMPMHPMRSGRMRSREAVLPVEGWSLPVTDPVTGKAVFVYSQPFRGPEGMVAGTASLSFPVESVLHANIHLQSISPRITSMIVRPSGSGETPDRLLLVARESEARPPHGRGGMPHGNWAMAEEGQEVMGGRPEALAAIAADLAAGRSGARQAMYQGRPSLWVYGPVPGGLTALLLVVPEEDVTADADAAEAFILERVRQQIAESTLWVAGVFLALAIFAVAVSKGVAGKIRELVSAARRVAGGDFETPVPVTGKDEFGELAETFNEMLPALRERIEIKKALDLAQELQMNLLPRTMPRLAGLDVAGRSVYSQETGGDFFDFIGDCPDGSCVGMAVGDVSGHGISAALLMASTRAYLRARMLTPEHLTRVVEEVNALVATDTYETGHFVTLALLRIDLARGVLESVRAGHDPILVYDPRDDSFIEPEGGGPALGLMPNVLYLASPSLSLAPGMLIFVGTDGIWEARDRRGEQYGKDRLRELLRRESGQSAETVLQAVLADLERYRDGKAQEDDVTLLVIKVRRPRIELKPLETGG